MPTPTKPPTWFNPAGSFFRNLIIQKFNTLGPDHSLVNTLCVILCFPSPSSSSSTTLYSFILYLFHKYTHTHLLSLLYNTVEPLHLFCFKYILQLYPMTNFWGKLPHVAFQHLLVICGIYRPVVKTKGMTKVFVYTILSSFLQTCSLPPFTLSKLCLNSHLNVLPTLPFLHVSLIAILFERGSCLCLQSAF